MPDDLCDAMQVWCRRRAERTRVRRAVGKQNSKGEEGTSNAGCSSKGLCHDATHWQRRALARGRRGEQLLSCRTDKKLK